MIHQEFWRQHPALLLGISFLIGIGCALFSLPLYFALPWLLYCLWLKRLASALAIFLAALYAHLLYGAMPAVPQPTTCTAPFSLFALQTHQSPFHRDLLYRGTLHYKSANLPCSIFLPEKNRPLANSDYLLSGTLHQRGPYDYVFKATEWTPIARTFSLAELRYQTKTAFRKFLKEKLASPRAAILLSSLATGEVDDRLLRFEFGRLGLQHILAISGFHFGVLMAFFSLFLGLFLPIRYKWIALVVLTTLYYLFIGSSPAVQRAWITASLYLFSKLLGRPTSPVNLLGGALLIELIFDPLVASNIGFQLSFGSCFGILLLHPPIDTLLKRHFPSRPASTSSQLPLASQPIYLLSNTFRSAISLTLAVNTSILPLLLYHFGKFPYLSLLYNLFYPALIALDLTLLLVTLLIHLLLPPLAAPLFHLLNTATSNLLLFTTYPPLSLDYSLYLGLPFPLLPLHFAALLLLALQIKKSEQALFSKKVYKISKIYINHP